MCVCVFWGRGRGVPTALRRAVSNQKRPHDHRSQPQQTHKKRKTTHTQKQLRVWSRVLSPDEIRKNMLRERPESDNGLAALYIFDNDGVKAFKGDNGAGDQLLAMDRTGEKRKSQQAVGSAFCCMTAGSGAAPRLGLRRATTYTCNNTRNNTQPLTHATTTRNTTQKPSTNSQRQPPPAARQPARVGLLLCPPDAARRRAGAAARAGARRLRDAAQRQPGVGA